MAKNALTDAIYYKHQIKQLEEEKKICREKEKESMKKMYVKCIGETEELENKLSAAVLINNKEDEEQVRKLLAEKVQEKHILIEMMKETSIETELKEKNYAEKLERLRKKVSSLIELSEGTIFNAYSNNSKNTQHITH